MKGSVKKAIIIIGVLIVLVICVLLNLRPVENFQQKYEGVDLSADVEGAVREGTYTKFLSMSCRRYRSGSVCLHGRGRRRSI